MNTPEYIKAIFSQIIDLFQRENPDCGGASDREEYINNEFTCEIDGWEVEISYKCSGIWDEESGDWDTPPYCELVRGWGEVTEISMCHFDENGCLDDDMFDDQLVELRAALNEWLKEI